MKLRHYLDQMTKHPSKQPLKKSKPVTTQTTKGVRRSNLIKNPVLLKCPFHLIVIGPADDFDTICNRYRLAIDKNDDCLGEVWKVTNDKTGDSYFVVHINEITVGAIAHEATHLTDWYFSTIGEREPSFEMRAYVTQAFCQWIEQGLL
jgi:hypothetical protein